MLTPEELSQIEQIVERVVKKALAQEPTLGRLARENLVGHFELQQNEIRSALKDLCRALRRLPPPIPDRKDG